MPRKKTKTEVQAKALRLQSEALRNILASIVRIETKLATTYMRQEANPHEVPQASVTFPVGRFTPQVQLAFRITKRAVALMGYDLTEVTFKRDGSTLRVRV